jgi:GMP synthase (glutamine-hydrolysing)
MPLPAWAVWGEEDKMIAFIQNDPDVPAGTYADWLLEDGIPFRIVRPYLNENLPLQAKITASIVLGGAMGANDTDKYPSLLKVRKHISDTVTSGRPYLGICLGGQLLTDVLGTPVRSNVHGERGIHSISLTCGGTNDPLFHGLPQQFISFQWHNDSFDIPPGAIRLAYSAACPNQALRYGRNAYGLQFHPEIYENIVANWCLDDATEIQGTEQILSLFKKEEDDYRRYSRQILNNFLRIAGIS